MKFRTDGEMWYSEEPGCCGPCRVHASDAGFDLSLSADVRLERDHITMCHTGVRVRLPEGCFGLLCVRSSLGARGVMMATGCSVIDQGYRGELLVPLVNLSDRTVALRRGDRIAQMVVVPCFMGDARWAPDWVDEDETDRGDGGFGSTGR